MKKVLRIVTLILAVCMSATLLVGCSLFGSLEPKDAKKNLKDADYEVELIDDEDELEEADVDGLIAVVYAYNEDGEFVTAYFFEEKADAKDYEEEMNEELADMIEEMNDQIKDAKSDGDTDLVSELKKELKEMENYVVKRIGKAVVTASSEDGIDAIKG